MSTDEMRKMLQLVFDQMEELKAELRDTIARNAEEQKRSNEEILSLTKRLYEILQENDALRRENEELHRKNESLESSQRISKKDRY